MFGQERDSQGEFNRNGLIPSFAEVVTEFKRVIEALPPGQRNVLRDYYRAQRWIAQKPEKPVKGGRLMRGLEKRINYQRLEEGNPGLLNDIACLIRSRGRKRQGRGSF